MNWWQGNGADGDSVSFGTQKSNGLNGGSGVTKNSPAKHGRKHVKKSEVSAKSGGRKGQQGDRNSVKILIIPENASEERLRIDEKFRHWSKVLLYPKTVTTFVAILEEICQHFTHTNPSGIGDPYDIQLLQSRLQTHVLINGGKTMDNILLAWRVFYKISACIDNEDSGDMFIQRKFAEAIYGMLFSGTNFYQRYSAATLRSICVDNLATSSVMDAQNLESLLKVINLSNFDCVGKMSEALWRIVCRYLSSNVERDREIVLLLFMHLVKDEQYVKDVILPKVLSTLAWSSSGVKYDLLTIVLAKYSYHSLAQSSHLKEFLKPEMFVNGLLLSLRNAELLPHSAKLLRLLVKQTDGLIDSFLVKLLKTGSSLEILNLTIHFERYLNLQDIYRSLELDQLTSHDLQNGLDFDFLRDHGYQNLILFRRLFHTSFVHHPDIEAIDSFINLNCSQHPDLTIRQQVLEIWKLNIESNARNFAQSINYIAEFVSQNNRIVEPTFHSYLLEQIPHFLKYFIANVPILVNGKKPYVNQLHMVDIILKFESLYLDGRYVQEQEIAVHMTIFLEFLKFMAVAASRSSFIYGHLKYPKHAEVKKRMMQLVRTLLVHDSNAIRTLTMEVAQMLVEADDAGYQRVEAMCLNTLANNGNIFETRLYTNQLLAMAAKEQSYSGSLVKFAEDVFKSFLVSETKTPAAIVCLSELFLRNNDVREKFAKLNSVERIQEAVKAAWTVVDSKKMERINGKSVTTKSKVNGVKNGCKNGHKEVFSTEAVKFLEVGVHFLACLTSYSLEKQLSLESLRTVISIFKEIFFRCRVQPITAAAIRGLGRIVATLTQCWTEKLYAFDDKTPYDDLMDFVKTELLDPATDNIDKFTAQDVETACNIIVSITTNDLSHECHLFNEVLNKILTESANNQNQQHHKRLLLTLIKYREFSERDRYSLDRVMQFVLELFETGNDELRNELFTVLQEKLALPEISIPMDGFQAKYSKTWNYVTDKVGKHALLDQAIATLFSNFRCNFLIDLSGLDSIVDRINTPASGVLLEARIQQLHDLPHYIKHLSSKLFATRDNGLRSAHLSAIDWCAKKYLDQGICIFFDNEAQFLTQMRSTFEASLVKLDDWPLAARSKLIDTLLALGFEPSDKVMFEVLFNSTSSSVATVDRVQWLNKISRLLNDEIEVKKRK